MIELMGGDDWLMASVMMRRAFHVAVCTARMGTACW
jgi:hypothetical protein